MLFTRLSCAHVACLLILCVHCSLSASAPDWSTVYIDSRSDGGGAPGTAFIEALQNNKVKTIVLKGDYTLARGLKLPAAKINRNVTVTSAPGTFRTIDFNYATGGAALCSTCTFLLKNLEVANGMRLQGMPFFRGDSTGASIILQNSVVTQLACAPLSAAYSLLKDSPRSRMIPAPAGGPQQELSITQLNFQGQDHENVIYAKDLAYDVPMELLEKDVYGGGVALAFWNVTRVCHNAVAESCLKGKSLAHCLDEMIIDLEAASDGAASTQAGNKASQDTTQQQHSLAPGAIAGVVIGALAGGLLLLAACAAFLVLRNRKFKRQQQLQKQSLGISKAAGDDAAAVTSGSGQGSTDRSREIHWSFGSFTADSINPWAAQSAKAAAGSKEGGKGRDQLGCSDIECQQVSDSGASGDNRRHSVGESRGQRLTAAISNKVRNIHEQRLAAGMGVAAAGAAAAAGASSDSRRQRKLSNSTSSQASEGEAEGGVRRLSSGGVGGDDNRREAAAAAADDDDFEVKDVLGRGGFGVVYKAIWHDNTVAVKVMHLPPGSKAVSAAAGRNPQKSQDNKSLLWAAMHGDTVSQSKSKGANAALEDMAVQEAAISSSMSHPNIVSVYNVSLKPIRHHRLRDLASGPGVSPRVIRAASAADEAGSSGSKGKDDSAGDSAASAPRDLDLVPWEMQLIMEYCDQGTLRDVLDAELIFDRSTKTNHIPTVLSLAQQVARAMQYLHKEHIIHGDLKANNVLLKSVAPTGLHQSDGYQIHNTATLLQPPPELALQQLQLPADAPQHLLLDHQQQAALPGCDLQWLPLRGCTVTAKVSDFGLSTSLDPSNTHITRLGPGTLTHTAPEMLIHGHCSRASDVYAYGMLLYELATSNRVFADVPRALLGHFVVNQNLRPRWPTALNKDPAWAGIIQLTELCWAQNPSSRPSFPEILAELGQLARGNEMSPSLTERLQQAGRCTPVAPVYPGLMQAGSASGGRTGGEMDGSFTMMARKPVISAPAQALGQALGQETKQTTEQQQSDSGSTDSGMLFVPLSNSAEEHEVVELSLQEAAGEAMSFNADAFGRAFAAAGGTGVATAAGASTSNSAAGRSGRRLSVVVEDHAAELLYHI